MPVITRQAQAFYLGSAQHLAPAGADFKLSGTAQIPLLLEDLIVSSKAVGAISTITLAGQNLNASGGSFPIQMLKPAAQLEGFRLQLHRVNLYRPVNWAELLITFLVLVELLIYLQRPQLH